MRPLLMVTTGVVLALATPAFAQQSSSSAPKPDRQHQASSSNTGQQNPAQIRQSIQHDLQQAGYTDIQVLPEAFLVHAKDHQGHPVTMMVEPGSVTAVTDLGRTGSTSGTPSNSGSSAHAGSGGSNSGSSSK